MTTNKFFTYLVICLCIPAAAAFAQPSGPFPDKNGLRKERAQLFKSLALTAEQKKSLDTNRAQYRQEVEALQQNIKVKRDALRIELEKPGIDLDKVKELHVVLKNLYGRLEDIHLQGVLGVRQILTPEQFSRFMEFNARMRPPLPPRR